MTTVQFHPRRADRPPCGVGTGDARLGEWILTPAPDPRFGKRAYACIERGDERVELTYSSPLLEDFLGAMRRIQADFIHRSDGTEETAAPSDRTRWSVHA